MDDDEWAKHIRIENDEWADKWTKLKTNDELSLASFSMSPLRKRKLSDSSASSPKMQQTVQNFKPDFLKLLQNILE